MKVKKEKNTKNTKNTKNNKDITGSPYFIAGLLVLVIVLVIGAIGYFVFDISNVKKQIVETNKLYEQNLREMAVLEQLRAQSEKAEEQLAVYEGILPADLGDVYILQENVVKTCENFGLEVVTIDVTQTVAQTNETTFTFNVNGSFSSIYDYLKYMSNLEQMHRFDALSLKKSTTKGVGYEATISLTVLSQNGAQGVLSANINEAVNNATS